MRKTRVEEIFDKYAKGYSSEAFAKPRYETARAAMSFADDITWHFIRKYLPKNKSAKILDAGGGDGFWAQKLVELGYKNITLTDLSQKMLVEARKRIAQLKMEQSVAFMKSDITNMKELENDYFDFVFSQYDAVSYCLRPAQAIRELARVAKRDAHVVVTLDTKFRRVPELIEARKIGEAEKLLETNISYDFDFPQFNLSWEELSDCFVRARLEILEIVGAPVFLHQIDGQTLKQLEADPKIRKRLLKMELAHCTNRSLVNFAGHLQIVGKKSFAAKDLRALNVRSRQKNWNICDAVTTKL